MDIAALSSATSAATSAASRLTADFDTFLTLLTTQLQNQDPLEPLDTEQFTQQLVQFAGVEQSIQTNAHLEALIALQGASENETALAMVDRTVSVDSDLAGLGEDNARWRYALASDAESASAQVFDADGDLVATFAVPTGAGAHEIAWGDDAEAGVYRLAIVAEDAAGDAVEATISSVGVVDAVAFDSGAPEIEIAGLRFTLDLVRRVDTGA